MGKGTTSKLWKNTRVPVAPLLPYINRYIAERDTSLDLLCSHIGIGGTRKKQLVEGGEIPFDLADKIVVFVSHPLIWHEDPALAEVYQGLDLAMLDKLVPTDKKGRFCKRIGCSKKVIPAPNKRGGKPKVFCSPTCRNVHNSTKARGGHSVRPYGKTGKKGGHLTSLVCVNGHDYTPENTYFTKDGYRQCRECQRDASRKWVQKKAKESV